MFDRFRGFNYSNVRLNFSSRPIKLVFLYWKHIEGIKLMTKYHFWMAIGSRVVFYVIGKREMTIMN